MIRETLQNFSPAIEVKLKQSNVVAVSGEDVVLRRTRVRELVSERGIDNPDRWVPSDAEADELNGIEGACYAFDDRKAQNPTITAGLLVSFIKEGGRPGYKPVGGRESGTLTVTPKVLRAVRGRCLSADGAYLAEVRGMFLEPAEKRGITPDDLVGQAMGPKWRATPPHPAFLPVPDGLRSRARYQAFVFEPLRPDVSVVREPGEGLFAWSCRFWRWMEA